MSTRVACQKCGASILPATAERTGGVCMPCAQPNRRDLEKLLAQPSTVLSLQEYLALIRDLPLPTSEQRRNFVEYVSTAHSWYKHLPPFLPGEPFYFFLDKFSAWDLVALEDGAYAIAEREQPGFHYSDIPTSEYRTRFGFLNYACAAGTAVIPLNHEARVIPRDKIVEIVREDGVPCCLPQPILDAGRVEITSVIFPGNWDPRVGWHPEPRRKPYWPSESGGQAILDKILKRSAEVYRPEWIREAGKREARAFELSKGLPGKERMALSARARLDPILSDLIEPERLRQKTEMLKAIDRVCMLIYDAGLPAPDSPR